MSGELPTDLQAAVNFEYALAQEKLRERNAPQPSLALVILMDEHISRLFETFGKATVMRMAVKNDKEFDGDFYCFLTELRNGVSVEGAFANSMDRIRAILERENLL